MSDEKTEALVDDFAYLPEFEDNEEAYSAGDDGDVEVSDKEEQEMFLRECAKWAYAVALNQEGLS